MGGNDRSISSPSALASPLYHFLFSRQLSRLHDGLDPLEDRSKGGVGRSRKKTGRALFPQGQGIATSTSISTSAVINPFPTAGETEQTILTTNTFVIITFAFIESSKCGGKIHQQLHECSDEHKRGYLKSN